MTILEKKAPLMRLTLALLVTALIAVSSFLPAQVDQATQDQVYEPWSNTIHPDRPAPARRRLCISP